VTDGRDPSALPSIDPEGVPVEELSYAEASCELDGIVEFFEHREVDVDQLVAKLRRATALVDELDRRVRRTRAQVEQLVPRLQAPARPVEEGVGPRESSIGEPIDAPDHEDDGESGDDFGDDPDDGQ
jgi:exonuclease VII small subunit